MHHSDSLASKCVPCSLHPSSLQSMRCRNCWDAVGVPWACFEAVVPKPEHQNIPAVLARTEDASPSLEYLSQEAWEGPRNVYLSQEPRRCWCCRSRATLWELLATRDVPVFQIDPGTGRQLLAFRKSTVWVLYLLLVCKTSTKLRFSKNCGKISKTQLHKLYHLTPCESTSQSCSVHACGCAAITTVLPPHAFCLHS